MTKRLIIGLGNPGPQYNGTRHNLGIAVLRAWAGDQAEWKTEAKLSAELAQVPNTEYHITALFPRTGMNESGQAVATFLKYHPVPFEQLLILHDELELPLGEVKLKPGGSPKGHNGVRSIHQHLGTDEIPRLRLGIGRPPTGVTVHDFVLGRFTPAEQPIVSALHQQASKLLSETVQANGSPSA